MYISNFTHFLDENGNIPGEMPEEARELASFLALVIDEATAHLPEESWLTDLPCFNRECDLNTITAFVENGNKIHWFCPECDTEGIISDWQGTRWDNTHLKLTDKEKQLMEDFFNNSLSEEDKLEFLERGSADRDFLKKFIRNLGSGKNNTENG
jgi:hypothetical protein